MSDRRGMALVAVLWLVTLLAAAVGAGVAGFGLAHRSARNRLALTRGHWAAEACLAIVAARWPEGRVAAADTMELGRTTRCAWQLDDPTARLNVNLVALDVLRRFFQGAGVEPDAAAALADAVVDRRARAPFTDVRQLEAIAGFPRAVLPHLTVDGPGRVNVAAAPPSVLRAFPGLSEHAVRILVDAQRRGRPVGSLDALVGALPPPDRELALRFYAELARDLAFGRSQVVVTATGWVGTEGTDPHATIEVLAAVLPERLAVLRRRMR
jgi:general secretion pathway protein K